MGATLVILALAVAFLVGMSVNQEDVIPPPPTLAVPMVAAQVPTTVPTAEARVQVDPTLVSTAVPEIPTPGPAPSRRAYGECLALTFLQLELHSRGDFLPWEGYGSVDVWNTIRYRAVDHAATQCRLLAPPPAEPSLGCVAAALETFYRRHVPQGEDHEYYRALGAEYALTLCQPAQGR